jgi:hypothetical protein
MEAAQFPCRHNFPLRDPKGENPIDLLVCGLHLQSLTGEIAFWFGGGFRFGLQRLV